MNRLALRIVNMFNRGLARILNFRWRYRYRGLIKKYGAAKEIPADELAGIMTFDIDEHTSKVIKICGRADAILKLHRIELTDSNGAVVLSKYLNSILDDPDDLATLTNLIETSKTGEDVYQWLVECGDIVERKSNFFVSTPEAKLELSKLRLAPLLN